LLYHFENIPRAFLQLKKKKKKNDYYDYTNPRT
jgi:hypothetical protein